MAWAFAEITFTRSVRAAQARYGSQAASEAPNLAEDRRYQLGPAEMAFIAARDSFYQATVTEDGWPYVQFRGGPPGFLRVLDERRLAYADFRGNRQYLSVGNLSANDCVALILVDYAHRRRLKILGNARVVHDGERLFARLASAAHRPRAERGVLINVAAWDWNCPQHITRRWTEGEIATLSAPLREELAALRADNERLNALCRSTRQRSRESTDAIK